VTTGLIAERLSWRFAVKKNNNVDCRAVVIFTARQFLAVTETTRFYFSAGVCMFRTRLYFIMVFCVLAAIAGAAHPFLLVQESEYAALRTLAESAPWSVMKARAIRDATGFIVYDPTESYGSRCLDGTAIISASALAYILDDVNKATYKDTLITQMNVILDDLSYRPDPAGYAENVDLGEVLFNSTLALDVIYNDLTAAEVSTIEGKIGPLVNVITTSWELSPYAVKGLWALYRGDATTFDSYRGLYVTEVDNHLSADGVPLTGNGYAEARFLAINREQKALFMDVLEYQGYHDFYTDDRVKNGHEYIFGYSANPFGRTVPFGDTSPSSLLRENNNAQVWRAYRFSEEAGQYAKWHMGNLWPQGRLATGLLTREAVPTGKLAPSRIFPDGGAFFIENTQSTTALYGAMWNPKSSYDHAHKDTNALAMSGYGQHLLVNSGYCGWGDGALGYTWTYINNRAYSGNTLRVDGTDHATKYGAGIIEGFTADKLDYACGDAGAAVSNGTHHRNLIFIQPVYEIGVNGYWIVFDDVTGSSYCLTNFHPNSTSITTVTANQEYEALISPATTTLFETGDPDVMLTTFLGTAPVSVTENDGLIAAWGVSFVARYLEVHHAMSGGQKQTCTVLFPHDSTHPKATLTRLSGTGYSGVSVVQGAYEDLSIESGTGEYVLPKCRFIASHSWSRFNGNQLMGYFAKDSTKFLDASLEGGFTSNHPVTIHMYGEVGKVIATQTTTLTLYSAAIPNGNTTLTVQPGESEIYLGTPTAVEPGVIYGETFDGSGSSGLNGKPPTTGQWSWIANSIARDNGALTPDYGSAVLPFNPETDKIYTVSMDVTVAGSCNIALGFSQSAPDNAGISSGTDRFLGEGAAGIAWTQLTGGGAVRSWSGFTTFNYEPTCVRFVNTTTDPAVTHTLLIIIYTAGDGSSFTADFLLDGMSVSGGPQTMDSTYDSTKGLGAMNLDAINYVGFSNMADGTGATIDNFSVTVRDYRGDLTLDGKVNMDDMAALSAGWQNPYPMSMLRDIAEDWLRD
jgi:hypothetical protein